MIGLDAVHGFDSDAVLASGGAFDELRSEIGVLGHTIVPLNSFDAATLSGLDAVILNIPYTQNSASYSVSDRAAIQAYVQKAVFVSDDSMFKDPGTGSERPISFGDNRRLLRNTIGYLIGGGVFFMGDDGSGFLTADYNLLTAPFGVSFSGSATDVDGRKLVSGFAPHPVTAGLHWACISKYR